MVAAQHKLSRRALLAGACAVPALGRHSGPFDTPQDRLDPESIFPSPPPPGRWTPDQVRGDERWANALTLYARAEAALEAADRADDDRLYDRALGRHNAALSRLLRTPAPGLAAAAAKLDLIMRHEVFELSFGETSLRALQRDLTRFAAAAGHR